MRLFLLFLALFCLSLAVDGQLTQVYKDDGAVLYFNETIDVSRTKWLISLYSKSWAHVRKNYGEFSGGEGGRLKAEVQTTAGEGGMSAGVSPTSQSIFMDVSPGAIRDGNLYDRPGSETRPNQDMLFEFQVSGISRIIEEGNNGMEGSPARGVWGTKGWTAICTLDIFLNSGLTQEAAEWRADKIDELVDAATAKNQVYWLKDWWIPLYEGQNGGTALLGRMFKLVADFWPKEGKQYKGEMDVGQFVHFMSGAANRDLKSLAVTALGWEEIDDISLAKAKKDFPNIKY